MDKKENPLAVQSKQWILNALLELMRQKSYHNISVKELAAKAALDRKTFYRHFKHKEDVLYLVIKEACERYILELRKLSELSSYEITRAYFSVCAQYTDFFDLLDRNGMLLLVLTKFDEYLPRLNEMFLTHPAYRPKSDYELIYQAGGFWNVTVHWIRNGTKEKPEELAGIVSAFMIPSSKQARCPTG